MSGTIKLKAADLVLGDKVQLFDDPYGWATVVRVGAGDTDDDPSFVEMFRPYVHIGDFTYTGGVLHYVGHEIVKVYRLGHREYEVDAYTHEQMSKPGALK